jgi:hypothetical protein
MFLMYCAVEIRKYDAALIFGDQKQSHLQLGVGIKL